MKPEWPLVGRDDELAQIETSLRDPSTLGTVLVGEAGVGKTRLLRESVTRAQAAGLRAVSAVATTAAQRVPFGALAHVLPPLLPPSQERENVIRSAARSILAEGGDPSLVAVDDAHRLDDHSAALLLHLATTRQARLLVTVRAGEKVPDPVVALWKDGICERLELATLSEPETAALVEEALGGQVDGGTQRRLWDHTLGNPLFLRELILAGLASESLVRSDGVWRWSGALTVSERLTEVIETRLGALNAEERRVAELAAIGEPAPVGLIESVVGRQPLAALERAGLVEEIRDQRRRFVRLSHPLYAEVIRAAIPPAALRGTVDQLAVALAASGTRRRGDLLRLASWRLEAGQPERPEFFLEAAAEALRLTDYVLAERLALAARDAGVGEAAQVYVQALIGQGRFREADRILANVAASPASEETRAAATAARAHNLLWNLGEGTEALGLLEGAAREVSDPSLQLELGAVRAYLLTMAGRTTEAIGAGRRILGAQKPPDRAIFHAVAATTQGLMYAGRPIEALEIWKRWEDTCKRVLPEVPFAPVGVAVVETLTHVFAGRFRDAEDVAGAAYRSALGHEAEWVRGFLAGLLGTAILPQGKARTAARLLRESVALLRPNDVLRHLTVMLAQLAAAQAMLGRLNEAREAIRECHGRSGNDHRMHGLFLALGEATVALCSGTRSEAAELSLRGAKEAAEIEATTMQAHLLHTLIRLGDDRRGSSALRQIAADSDSPLIHTYARHAEALDRRDAEGLEEVAKRFEEMPAYLLAAEALAQAASVHRARGDSAVALATVRRAKALAELCEGARTPALAEIDAPLPLTPRELEIATLAARGMTSREIADALVLSVRTVDNHLTAVYSKLGVSGRRALADILGIRTRDSASSS